VTLSNTGFNLVDDDDGFIADVTLRTVLFTSLDDDGSFVGEATLGDVLFIFVDDEGSFIGEATSGDVLSIFLDDGFNILGSALRFPRKPPEVLSKAPSNLIKLDYTYSISMSGSGLDFIASTIIEAKLIFIASTIIEAKSISWVKSSIRDSVCPKLQTCVSAAGPFLDTICSVDTTIYIHETNPKKRPESPVIIIVNLYDSRETKILDSNDRDFTYSFLSFVDCGQVHSDSFG
jgi:hypothetical protein